MKKWLLFAFVPILTIVIGIFGYLVIVFLGDYVINEEKLVFESATKLVDENGAFISTLYKENRELVSIQNVPKHVREAFITVEDERFYDHHGVDIKAICRALVRDILSGEKGEGGSTITQQLAKNVFLTQDKSFLRKAKELVIALNLERRYTKEQILEMYVNQTYFGHGAYGIQSAAKFYFHKDVKELTVEDGAMLAAIPKAPSTYSPIVHKEKALERRNLVLSMMAKRGLFSSEDAVRYKGRTIALDVQQMQKNPAYATYIDMVLDEAEKEYHLSNLEVLKGGYTIVVPIQQEIQLNAYSYFQDKQYFPGVDDEVEGAFVLINHQTGGIQAVVGGRKYVAKGLNRVNVKRQPGSTIKPLLVYGPALERGDYHPYSLLPNEKLNFGTYSPKNYNQRYSKEITMYEAIETSANVPAVWLLNDIGISYGKNYLEKMNLSIKEKGLSIALGGLAEGVTPLELATAYSAFAEGGKQIEPYVITKIMDRNGEVIGEHQGKEHAVFSPQTAWNITRILEGVVEEGTGKMGVFHGALAGKTGSTSAQVVTGATKDAWFVGYTPEVVGAVWMGYDRTTADHYLTGGSSYPTKLFKEILENSYHGQVMVFAKPKDVKELAEPIRLEAISHVKGNKGFFTAILKWKPLEDKRIRYRIYKIDGKRKTLVGTVTGKGEYKIKFINIFSPPSFSIVPYNPQTKKEGEQTDIIKF